MELTEKEKSFIELSKESGKHYGYKDCCIDAFCVSSIAFMRGSRPNKHDQLRLRLSVVNGIYSGFIPCLECAQKIVKGQARVIDLIDKEKRTVKNPFPLDWSLI